MRNKLRLRIFGVVTALLIFHNNTDLILNLLKSRDAYLGSTDFLFIVYGARNVNVRKSDAGELLQKEGSNNMKMEHQSYSSFHPIDINHHSALCLSACRWQIIA